MSAQTQIIRDGLTDVCKGFAYAQIYAFFYMFAVYQQRCVFSGVVGAGGSRVTAVVCGDEQDVIIMHGVHDSGSLLSKYSSAFA